MVLLLHFLQTSNNILAAKNSMSGFPVPIDIITHLMGRNPYEDEKDEAEKTTLETLVH